MCCSVINLWHVFDAVACVWSCGKSVPNVWCCVQYVLYVLFPYVFSDVLFCQFPIINQSPVCVVVIGSFLQCTVRVAVAWFQQLALL